MDIVEGLTEETVTKVVTALGFKKGKQDSVCGRVWCGSDV